MGGKDDTTPRGRQKRQHTNKRKNARPIQRERDEDNGRKLARERKKEEKEEKKEARGKKRLGEREERGRSERRRLGNGADGATPADPLRTRAQEPHDLGC